jgi:hypothetical protein
MTSAQALAEEWLANAQQRGSPECVADALAFLGTISEGDGPGQAGPPPLL